MSFLAKSVSPLFQRDVKNVEPERGERKKLCNEFSFRGGAAAAVLFNVLPFFFTGAAHTLRERFFVVVVVVNGVSFTNTNSQKL